MLGLGVGVAEEPLLARPSADGPVSPYRAAVARGAHFFNAHPYLAGLAGRGRRACRARRGAARPDRASGAAPCAGPLGSIGDRLIWAGWAAAPVRVSRSPRSVWAPAGLRSWRFWSSTTSVTSRCAGGRCGRGGSTACALPRRCTTPCCSVARRSVGPAMALRCRRGAAAHRPVPRCPVRGLGAPVLAVGAVLGFLALHWLPGRLTGLRLGLGFAALALGGGWRRVGWDWR